MASCEQEPNSCARYWPWPCAGSFLVVDEKQREPAWHAGTGASGPGVSDDYQGGVDGDGGESGRLERSFSVLVRPSLSRSGRRLESGNREAVPVGRAWTVSLRRREGSSRFPSWHVRRCVARRAVAGHPRPRRAPGAHGTARVRLHSRMTSRTSCSIRRSPHLFGWPVVPRQRGRRRSAWASGSLFGIGRVICLHEV